MKSWEKFLVSSHVVALSYSIAGLIFTKHFNHQPLVYKWLAVGLLFSALTEILAEVFYRVSINPNFATIPYQLLSLATISAFFYHAMPWRSSKILIVVNVVYSSFTVINYIFIQKFQSASYPQTFRSLAVIFLSISFFYKMLKELPTHQLQKDPLFWIVSGFFFSYSGKLAIYSVTHYLITILDDNMIIVWTIHNFLTLVSNICIIYAAYLRTHNSKFKVG
jgi:hypothetical protein